MKLSSILKTKTLRQSSITLFGTLVSGIVGAISYIWVARLLGPVDYGVFAVAIATMGLLASVSNVGTDTGIIRFVGKYWTHEPGKALKFMKLGFLVKVTVWVMVLLFGWIFIPVLSNSFLGKPELLVPLRISLLGVGGTLLFSFVCAGNQAIGRFAVWSGLMIFSNILRIVLIGALVYLMIFDLYGSLWIFILMPLAAFLGGVLLLPRFLGSGETSSVRSEFFGYNKWVAAFTILTAISSRLDTYLAVRFLSLELVGVYSVAVTLAAFVSQFTLAIATVVAPKLSGMDKDEDAWNYLVKLQGLVVVLGFIGGVAGLVAGYFLIPVLYGPQYSGSFTPFVFLLLSQVVFFMAIPAHTAAMYYFSYPKLFVLVGVVYLFVVGFLGWVLISSYGVVGAGLSMLVAQCFNFLIPFVWVFGKFRSRRMLQ